jgi:hypothetical protein
MKTLQFFREIHCYCWLHKDFLAELDYDMGFHGKKVVQFIRGWNKRKSPHLPEMRRANDETRDRPQGTEPH